MTNTDQLAHAFSAANCRLGVELFKNWEYAEGRECLRKDGFAMKYDMTFRMLKIVLDGITKKEIRDKKIMKDIGREYRAIAQRAGDIGSKNRLLGSYAMTAYYIAMNRFDGLSPEENCRILEEGLGKSRLYKATMGSADSYFSEKNMASRRAWSKETHDPAHRKAYPNDWVVDVIEKGDGYEFGFDYTECGDCKLCRDEGCPELAKHICRLDYMTTDLMGVGLDRTMILSEGAPKCDFRFKR